MLESMKVTIIEGIEARGGSASVGWLFRSPKMPVRVLAFSLLVRSDVCGYKNRRITLREYNRG